MEKFIFTYGTSGQPYCGGWTEVVAPNRGAACAAFRAIHPDKTDGLLNCCCVYRNEQFEKTEMAKTGNFGAFCHETIALVVEVHG